jgi:hypothetical protein
VGDTLKILGNVIGGSTPANDLALTVLAVTTEITGGERLFAIPVNAAQGGILDLSSVKQLGTSAIPGTGVYPDGPEVLVVQITALTTQTTPTGDVQLSFKESQAYRLQKILLNTQDFLLHSINVHSVPETRMHGSRKCAGVYPGVAQVFVIESGRKFCAQHTYPGVIFKCSVGGCEFF